MQHPFPLISKKQICTCSRLFLSFPCRCFARVQCCFVRLKLRENGRNIVGQQLPTLLDVTCCVRLHTLLHVVECRCAKFETSQTFQPTTPNISFVSWSPKRSATMLDPFAQLFHYCWGHAWFTKIYGLYPFHDALQVPTLLGVVACVCKPLPTRTQQPPTLLAQQCWKLLRPFARSLKRQTS